MGRPKLHMLNLIDSNVDLFIYLIEGIMVRIKKPQDLRMRWQNVPTNKKKSSTSRRGAAASYQTSHPGILSRTIAFGRSWPFAAFCNRTRLPVLYWGRNLPDPKPYETNPTPTHSSRPTYYYNFTKDFHRINIQEKIHFISHMVTTGDRAIQRLRTRPGKGNKHTSLNFLSSGISE